MVKIKGEPWSKEKNELFRKMYPTASWSELADIFKMTKGSMLHKASKLGISRENVDFAYYTPYDIQFLKDNYGELSLKQIAEKLNRTESAIYTKITKLGLKKRNSWTEKEIDLLKKVYSDYSNQELSEIFFCNRTPNAIRTMGLKFGLKKHNPAQEKKYDKDKILEQFKELYKKLGRTPLATELQLYGLPSESTYSRYFVDNKGYREFCNFVGIPINKSFFGKKDYRFYSKNNDLCFSKSELLICDFFYNNNIKYRKEELYYKDIFGIEDFGTKRMDFLLSDNTVVEYFGLIGYYDYNDGVQQKIDLCKKYNINLIPLYYKDLNNLHNIFEKYI